MPGILEIHPEIGHRRLRLETLVRLRWLAVAGQTAAIMLVQGGLGFPLALAPCLTLVGLSAWFNLLLRLRYPANLRLEPWQAALLLGYDVAQLAALLYLTGGLQNPFAFLFLVPVMVSATTLPPRHTLGLGLMALACATLLGVFHLPLPWFPGESLHIPFLYVAGVWTALASSLAFMAVYAWRVAEEARQLSDALAATELVLAHEQHLSALDGLAAAAAHELGTPLGTINLVAKELRRDMPPGTPHGDDVALLIEQIDRCRAILGKLTSLDADPDMLARMPLSLLIAEVVEPHRDFETEITVEVDRTGGDEPIGRRNPGILYGLGNLVENAVDFARGKVVVRATWDASWVKVSIIDDGPGFAPDVLNRLGEPYVTTRGRGRRTSGEHEGLGLGFFIAKTLLERTGARISLANREGPEMGAVVTVVWPRSAMDFGREAEEKSTLTGVSASPFRPAVPT